MIEVGTKVMVGDPYIGDATYRVPPAEVIEVITQGDGVSKIYVLRFDNGAEECFAPWQVKTQ